MWGVGPCHARLGADTLQFLQHVGVHPTNVGLEGDLLDKRNVVARRVDHRDNFKRVLLVEKQRLHVLARAHCVVQRYNGARFFVEFSCGAFLGRLAGHRTPSEIAEFATFVPAGDIPLGAEQQVQVVVLCVDGVGQNGGSEQIASSHIF